MEARFQRPLLETVMQDPFIFLRVNFLEYWVINLEQRASGVISNSFGINGPLGKGGNITITTAKLEMDGGGGINSATQSSGVGGNVTIDAQRISIAGQAEFEPSDGGSGSAINWRVAYSHQLWVMEPSVPVLVVMLEIFL